VKRADRILELLYDRQEAFCLPDELAAATGMTRTAADRAVEEIARRGQTLEFSPANGVRLRRPVRLDAHLIERNLGTKRAGRNVICFEQVDSTNDVAFDSARQAGADGLAVLAESQRQGRGRRGRRWISPPQAGVLMSVLLIDPASSLAHDALTIAAGVATTQGVEDACGVQCRLKWPNDVLLDDGKLAGVLVEVRRRASRRCVVVGIGVNVNAAPPARQVGQPARSLAQCLGHSVERIEVARAVLRRLDDWVSRIRHGRTDDLHDQWLYRCDMVNQRVCVLCNGKRHVGRVLDVSPLEGLMLSQDNGLRVELPAEGSTLL